MTSYMAPSTNGTNSVSSETRKEELIMELENIQFEVEWEYKELGEQEKAFKVYQRVCPELKNFAREGATKEGVNWNQVKEQLKGIKEKERILALEEEISRLKNRELNERLERLERGMTQQRRWSSGPRKEMTRCYRCGRMGHISYECKEGDQNNLNKKSFEYMDIEVYKKEFEYGNDDKDKRVRLSIETLEEKYPEVFDVEGKVKFCGVEECRIETEEGKRVVKKGAMIPQEYRKDVQEYLENLEKRGIIRRSESQWRNPIRAIRKPDGGIRIASNLMALNDLSEKDSYKLPEIRKIINATQGSRYFTVLDLKEGHYQVKIKEEHRFKTAFEFENKVYEWCGMVMGFKNAPMIFQRVINKVLEDFLGKGVEVYLDDVVIHAKTIEEHDELVEKVVRKLKENNMRINRTKAQLGLEEVKLLGVTINGKEQIPWEIKKNEALEYPEPRSFSELRRFLGLAGWFRQFIKRYAEITSELFNGLKRKQWEWTDKMKEAFEKIKKELREAKNLRLPDYEKKFILRTDASNVGLGAVLMQEDEDGKQRPIQWASKKLTDVEKRYGITEKEMLAVVWGIEKFEYELRGRKFHLITDHKALEFIRSKAVFENDRVNRWIERIQEYDFTIEYNKGETLVAPDALSRVYMEDDEKEKKEKKKVEKWKETKWKNHVIEQDGFNYWKFDSGEIRMIPKEEVRNELIDRAHEQLMHRGAEAVYYRVKTKYYWPGMKREIREHLKKCEVCEINNRKSRLGYEFVETSRIREKFAVDIMKEELEDVLILVGIDYFSRGMIAETIKNRSVQEIKTKLEKWFGMIGKPEEIVSDNAKEFVSRNLRDWCGRLGINRRLVSVESHQSNGRVERAIRTIRDGLVKNKVGSIEERLERIVEGYNETYHEGIKCTPEEAWNNQEKAMIQNSRQGEYSKRFMQKEPEKFIEGQQVRVAKRENLGKMAKSEKGRFLGMGEIVKEAGENSYIVRDSEGKLKKKRYYDLKAIRTVSGETPSCGGDVVYI